MNRISVFTIFVILLLHLSCSPDPGFNLNIAPPPDSAWPEDIYPAETDGIKPYTYTPEYGGTVAVYDKKGKIYVARMKDQNEATSFFKEEILPDLSKMAACYTGNINGYFYASSVNKDSCCFGWINKRYIFMLTASDKNSLKKLADYFKYIEVK